MAGLGVSLLETPSKMFANEDKSTVRIGMIAVGLRGQTHLEEMLKRKDVDIIAMADPNKKMMAMAQKLVSIIIRKPQWNIPPDLTIIKIY